MEIHCAYIYGHWKYLMDGLEIVEVVVESSDGGGIVESRIVDEPLELLEARGQSFAAVFVGVGVWGGGALQYNGMK